jgi:hypothetical protein
MGYRAALYTLSRQPTTEVLAKSTVPLSVQQLSAEDRQGYHQSVAPGGAQLAEEDHQGCRQGRSQ